MNRKYLCTFALYGGVAFPAVIEFFNAVFALGLSERVLMALMPLCFLGICVALHCIALNQKDILDATQAR